MRPKWNIDALGLRIPRFLLCVLRTSIASLAPEAKRRKTCAKNRVDDPEAWCAGAETNIAARDV